MSVYFRGVFYACINSHDDENNCDQPLLDSIIPSRVLFREKVINLKLIPQVLTDGRSYGNCPCGRIMNPSLEDELIIIERRSISPCSHDVSNDHKSFITNATEVDNIAEETNPDKK